jgi:adenine/guanine/hypoxanthine permease
LALTRLIGVAKPNGDFPRSKLAFSVDALATIFGSIFGLTPVTSYIESGSGIEAGARTGLTAVLCGFFFFLSIFFAPIIASIPPWATGGALIVVGALMSRSLMDIKWYNITHAATSFLTLTVMPLTYSIAYGLIAGIGCYAIMTGTFKLLALVGIAEPVFEPVPRTVDHVDELIKKDKEKELAEDSADTQVIDVTTIEREADSNDNAETTA